MSRARHRKEGGRLSSEPKWNAGGEQNAAKEAEERKKGGRIHAEGEEGKKRHDRKERARGGHVEHSMEKKKEKHEHKGRARGGRIGANLMPLSTAARVKHVTKGETPEEGGPDGKDVHNP
jgi:hypothetical protein